MKKINLSFNAGEIIGDKLYFSVNNFNSLYCYNFVLEKCECVCQFLDEPNERINMHITCLKYDKSLIFIPFYGKHIHIYCTIDGSQQVVSLKNKVANKDDYCDAIIYKDELWIFPKFRMGSIVIVNLKTLDIRENHEINEWVNNNVSVNKDLICTRIVYEDNFVWMPIYGTNKLIKYNLDDNIIESYEIENLKLFGVYFGGQYLWVSEISGSKVFKISKTGEIIKTYKIVGDFNENDRVISQIISVRNKVYLFDCQNGYFYELNENKFCFENKYKNHKQCKYQKDAFFGYCVDNEDIYVFPFKANGIIKLNNNSTFYTTDCECSEDVCKWILKRKIDFKEVIVENKILNLKTFIEYIKG